MKSTLTGNKNLDIDILNQLDDKDLVSFCSTSKYAKQLCNDQILWQRRTIALLGDVIPLEMIKKYKGDRTWSDYYIELSKTARSDVNKLLINSSRIGRLDLVILSLNLGANIHVEGDLPLRISSRVGRLEVVKYLVSQGAKIHVINDQALRTSSRDGRLEVVKYLVSQGADIHANNDQALRWAHEKGHTEIVKYLEEQMVK